METAKKKKHLQGALEFQITLKHEWTNSCFKLFSDRLLLCCYFKEMQVKHRNVQETIFTKLFSENLILELGHKI